MGLHCRSPGIECRISFGLSLDTKYLCGSIGVQLGGWIAKNICWMNTAFLLSLGALRGIFVYMCTGLFWLFHPHAQLYFLELELIV